MTEIYEPREDSFFFLEVLKKQKFRKNIKVLDVGTGSGILAEELSRFYNKIVALDIDKNSVKYAKQHVKNVVFLISDLLSGLKAKFDLIVFNAPYLPSEKPEDKALDGGVHGYEVVEKFINQLPAHLSEKGCCLLLISSLTNPKKIKEVIKNIGLKFKILAQKNLFFEKLFIYKIGSIHSD